MSIVVAVSWAYFVNTIVNISCLVESVLETQTRLRRTQGDAAVVFFVIQMFFGEFADVDVEMAFSYAEIVYVLWLDHCNCANRPKCLIALYMVESAPHCIARNDLSLIIRLINAFRF